MADIFEPVASLLCLCTGWFGTKKAATVVAMNRRIVVHLVGPEGDGVRLDAFLSAKTLPSGCLRKTGKKEE